jgi:hypothetical protein
VRLGDHFKAFQWFLLAYNVLIEVSPEVLATTKLTHLQPDGLNSNTICTTDWYAKTILYHILSQVVLI